MSRSLKIHPKFIDEVKSKLPRNGFVNQKELADSLDLSPSTVWNFLNGKPVDVLNFYELCDRLSLNYQEIADFGGKNNKEADRTLDLSSQSVNDDDLDEEPPDTEFPNYIERPPNESRCYQIIAQPGSLLRIKAPKRMGKSLLIDRVLKHAQGKNYRTVRLSLLLADRTVLKSLDDFLRWFSFVVCRELQLPNQLADYWEEGLSSSYSCTIYIEEYVLAKLDSPLLLALDDVDHVFAYPNITEDFFAMLRSWYDEARSRKIWKKLRLVLAYSTEELVQLNINQSPFNVGEFVTLPEFNQEQVEQLARQQEWDGDSLQVEKLMDMVGGHPYLVQQAISCLTRQEITFEQLLQTASTESSIYGSYLRAHLLNLQQNPELADAMKQVVAATNPIQLESTLTFKLESLGLVKLNGNEVTPSCNLYVQYFRERLT